MKDICTEIIKELEKMGYTAFQITPEMSIHEDLGLDSLDTIELVAKLEEKFDIRIKDDDLVDVKTIQDIVDIANKYLK